MPWCSTLQTAVGTLYLQETQGAITAISVSPVWGEPRETPLLQQAKRELTEYFRGQRTVFTLPISTGGTPFQEKVWAALRQIPYGETRTYGQIARDIGNPKSCRAVGGANHRNPLLIVTPCHRVIGADGTLTGFGGGLPMKTALLALEQAHRKPE